MADSDRVTFPDEVEDVKAAAAEASPPEAGDSNTIEETTPQPSVAMRNMIVTPSNCPPGFKMGADGTNETGVKPVQAEDTMLSAFGSRKLEDKKQGGVEAPILLDQPSVTKRNMIKVPDNCEGGKQMGQDGVCREVFD